MKSQLSKYFSQLRLGQGLLVIAGVLAWNTLALGYTLFVHNNMQRWDWWWVIAMFAFLLLLAISGLLIVHSDAKKNEIAFEFTPRKRWLISLKTGGVTFLLGWIPCAFIMMRMNSLDGWCHTGILGAVLVDWLPVGVVISMITTIFSRNVTKGFLVP